MDPGGPPFAEAPERQAAHDGKGSVFAKAAPDMQLMGKLNNLHQKNF